MCIRARALRIPTYISVPGYLLTMGNATSRDPMGPYHPPARPAPSVHRTPPYTPPSDKPLILFINQQRGINIAPSPLHARGERDVVNDGNTFAASTGIRECGRRTFNSLSLSVSPSLSLSLVRCYPSAYTPAANPSSLYDPSLVPCPSMCPLTLCLRPHSLRASLSDLTQWNVG